MRDFLFLAVLAFSCLSCILCGPSDIGKELPGFPRYRVVKYAFKSWSSAQRECRKHGGDLVCFETLQEWQNVGSALIKHFPRSSFRIGAHGNGHGLYIWTSNKNVIPNNHTAWYEDLNCTGCRRQEPNYGGGNGVCVYMSTSRNLVSNWYDDPCFWKKDFICEF